jgi:hypothetical protein
MAELQPTRTRAEIQSLPKSLAALARKVAGSKPHRQGEQSTNHNLK